MTPPPQDLSRADAERLTKRQRKALRRSLERALKPAKVLHRAGKRGYAVYDTKLDRMLFTKGIRPAWFALVSGYSRQHLLRVRANRMRPTSHCILSCTAAMIALSGDATLTPLDLFDLMPTKEDIENIMELFGNMQLAVKDLHEKRQRAAMQAFEARRRRKAMLKYVQSARPESSVPRRKKA